MHREKQIWIPIHDEQNQKNQFQSRKPVGGAELIFPQISAICMRDHCEIEAPSDDYMYSKSQIILFCIVIKKDGGGNVPYAMAAYECKKSSCLACRQRSGVFKARVARDSSYAAYFYD